MMPFFDSGKVICQNAFQGGAVALGQPAAQQRGQLVLVCVGVQFEVQSDRLEPNRSRFIDR